MPAQQCVVVANDQGDFDAASSRVDAYVAEHQFDVSAAGRDYIICERYSYDGEGFARYSLPIIFELKGSKRTGTIGKRSHYERVQYGRRA
ncbi:hypothetical protein [Paenibacillus dendritiformis]|uniref:hypothetical protein n=1 Tax=Paenibacillus dendritiformis TaxID=130049 RepID=UPI001F0FB9A9|nr:hypothetical protein [Paenibacillus dendritiformis]